MVALTGDRIAIKISADCNETSFYPCGSPVRVLLKLTGFSLFYGLSAFMLYVFIKISCEDFIHVHFNCSLLWIASPDLQSRYGFSFCYLK